MSADDTMTPEEWEARQRHRVASLVSSMKDQASRHERKVRAPRFSDLEMERLSRQAQRVASQKSSRFKERPMPPLEFIREAAMGLVSILEEVPEQEGFYDLRDWLFELGRIARDLQSKRTAHAPERESTRKPRARRASHGS